MTERDLRDYIHKNLFIYNVRKECTIKRITELITKSSLPFAKKLMKAKMHF